MVEGRNGKYNSSNASPNAHSSEDCLNESNDTGNRKAVGEKSENERKHVGKRCKTVNGSKHVVWNIFFHSRIELN